MQSVYNKKSKYFINDKKYITDLKKFLRLNEFMFSNIAWGKDENKK